MDGFLWWTGAVFWTMAGISITISVVTLVIVRTRQAIVRALLKIDN